jgi:hypothetical protein
MFSSIGYSTTGEALESAAGNQALAEPVMIRYSLTNTMVKLMLTWSISKDYISVGKMIAGT